MKSYFCQRSPSGHVGFLLFCLAMAVLAVLSWPMLPLASGHETHVKIEATGIRDPAGKSSEVWITQMPAGVDAGCLAENSVGASGQRGAGAWERRGTILVSYKDQPAVAECDVVADPEGTFRFGTHALSGEVILTVNGVSRKMQLYSLQPGGVNVSLSEFPQGKIGQRGNLIDVGLWIVALTAALWLAGTSLDVISFRRAAEMSVARPGIMGVAALSLPSLLIFAIVLAGTWPAQMSADSAAEWAQLHEVSFNLAVPVLPILLIGIPGLPFDSLGPSMILQIIVLSAAIGFLCAEIARWGLGMTPAWVAAILTPLVPSVALLSTVFWKDIPFAAFVAILTALVLQALRTRGQALAKNRFQVILALVLFAIAATRLNGLIATALVAAFLCYVFHPILARRGVLVLLVGAIGAPILWNGVVLPATGRVQPIPEIYGGLLPMHLLGAMMAAGAELPAETQQKMQSILPLDVWKQNYNCLSAGPLFFRSDVQRTKLGRDLVPYALSAALEHPLVALRHFACMNALNWQISPTDGSIGLPLGIPPDLFAGPLSKFRVVPAPVESINTALHQLLRWTTAETWRTVLFWRPAFLQFILVFMAGALLILRRELLAPMSILPVLATTLSLVPLISSQDFRYQYCLYVAGLPLLIFLTAMVTRGRLKPAEMLERQRRRRGSKRAESGSGAAG